MTATPTWAPKWLLEYGQTLESLMAEPGDVPQALVDEYQRAVTVVELLTHNMEMEFVWLKIDELDGDAPQGDFYDWVCFALEHAHRMPYNYQPERKKLLNRTLDTLGKLHDLLEKTGLHQRRYLVPKPFIDSPDGVNARDVLDEIKRRTRIQLDLYPLSSKKTQGHYQRSVAFQRLLYAHLYLAGAEPIYEIIARTTATLSTLLYEADTYEGISPEAVRGVTRHMTREQCRAWVTNPD